MVGDPCAYALNNTYIHTYISRRLVYFWRWFVGALPSASWVFGSLRGVVLGWPGGPVPFLKIAFPPKCQKAS